MFASPRGFHLFIGVYLAAVFLARTVPFPSVGTDQAWQLLYSQAFDWGYDLRNPPLFTWLVIAAQQVLGVSLVSLEAVRFALLSVTYLLVYRSARLILQDDRLAALAALSLMAVYVFAWDIMLTYTHALVVAAMVPAGFYALLRLDAKDSPSSYVVLGVALGLGLMSKYTYAIFAVSLLAAAMTDRRLRSRLLHVKALVSVGLALVIVLPNILWYLNNSDNLTAVIENRFEISQERSRLAAAGLGLTAVASTYFNFFASPVVLLSLFFWKAFTPLRGVVAPSERFRRLLGKTFITMSAVIVLLILAFEATKWKNTYMVVFILFPIYFFARVQAVGVGATAVNRFTAALMLVAAVVPATLLAMYVVDPLRCRKCYFHIPFAAFAEDLRRAGFERGTILSLSHVNKIGGNLRPHFPDSRIVDLAYPHYAPPPPRTEGQCLLIWGTDRNPRGKELVLREAARRFGADVDTERPSRTMSHRMAMSTDRVIRFSYILIPEGSGDCR